MLSVKERELIIRLHQKGETQQYIAGLIGCSQPTVHKWVSCKKSGRTLRTLPRSGRPTKLTKRNLERLRKKILVKVRSANNAYCSASTKQVADIIQKEIGETYSLRHVERIMHRLGFSLITPRPQHIKHDQAQVDKFRDAFKKNSKRSMWAMN